LDDENNQCSEPLQEGSVLKNEKDFNQPEKEELVDQLKSLPIRDFKYNKNFKTYNLLFQKGNRQLQRFS